MTLIFQKELKSRGLFEGFRFIQARSCQIFVSQWGSAQLSDDTPPCSVRIFLTHMRLD